MKDEVAVIRMVRPDERGPWCWPLRALLVLGVFLGSILGPVGGLSAARAQSGGALFPSGTSSEEGGQTGPSIPARASEGKSAEPPEPPIRGSGPRLDSLLELPPGFGAGSGSPAVAGTSEAEWRRRFEQARRARAEARARLAATRRELDGVVEEGGGSQWNVAPAIGGGGGGSPGGGSSPLSFKLRQDLKRHREDVEAAERAMRELRIEADLAGVPAAWRGKDDPSVPETSRELWVP